MRKYAIGLDYGTLAVRALLMDIQTGDEVAVSTYTYPHSIMHTQIPTGRALPAGFALQHPQDYLEGCVAVIHGVMEQSGVRPEEVISIGLDATAATVLPVKLDKTPLCCLPEFCDDPHSYAKLWKHHGAEEEAKIVDRIAKERNEPFLPYYGNKVSSEWAVPKYLETLRQSPEVYRAADRFMEALDWIIWNLTDQEGCSACGAGYKTFYRHDLGYPSREFFQALDPRMENFAEEKLSYPIRNIGEKAGELTESMAAQLGLLPGTPVGVGIIDAHASMVGSGISRPGTMLITVGTSSCHTILSETGTAVPGIAGVVKDGIMPGYFAYELGQSCVGDHYAWFTQNCVPEAYEEEARQKGLNIHQLLTEKLRDYKTGQSGLLALDWYNGVRSPLMDFDLNGLILGMNLQTKPEEIYLALIEATAYGTRLIIDTLEAGGVTVEQLVLGGGIPRKNRLLVQVYADICGRPIRICDSGNTSAKGAALCGLAAADSAVTGFRHIGEAAEALCQIQEEVFQPIAKNSAVYEKLFKEYCTLCDYFGKGANDVMKRLNAIRAGVQTPQC